MSTKKTSVKSRNYPSETKQAALDALAAGEKIDAVALRMGIPVGTVRTWYYAKVKGAQAQKEPARAGGTPEATTPPDNVTHIHVLDSPFLGKGARCDEVKPVMNRAPAPGDIPYSEIPLLSNPTTKGSMVVSNPEARKSSIFSPDPEEGAETTEAQLLPAEPSAPQHIPPPAPLPLDGDHAAGNEHKAPSLEDIAGILRGGRLVEMYLVGADIMMVFLPTPNVRSALCHLFIRASGELDILEPLGGNAVN